MHLTNWLFSKKESYTVLVRNCIEMLKNRVIFSKLFIMVFSPPFVPSPLRGATWPSDTYTHIHRCIFYKSHSLACIFIQWLCVDNLYKCIYVYLEIIIKLREHTCWGANCAMENLCNHTSRSVRDVKENGNVVVVITHYKFAAQRLSTSLTSYAQSTFKIWITKPYMFFYVSLIDIVYIRL